MAASATLPALAQVGGGPAQRDRAASGDGGFHSGRHDVGQVGQFAALVGPVRHRGPEYLQERPGLHVLADALGDQAAADDADDGPDGGVDRADQQRRLAALGNAVHGDLAGGDVGAVGEVVQRGSEVLDRDAGQCLRQAGHPVVGERENDVAVCRQERGVIFVQAALGAAEHEHGRQRPAVGGPVAERRRGRARVPASGSVRPERTGEYTSAAGRAGPAGLGGDQELLGREPVAGRSRVRRAGRTSSTRPGPSGR